ncbi:hypothetical protein PIB30_054438 [Stylosanthes scabra]|uniref:SANTA domain-containing protein n=2 Tax=Stylosanthes scabra TaxID=79078 RepID=A0ABU6RIP9_9FABA|nr:hypothetical protein [Stylosanthes scabra]
MAESTSTPSTSNNANLSSFQPTVSLYEWWLVKAEHDFDGKRLAIGGIASRKEEAVRVFITAPITKRHDLFSLETADGIYILIRGFIDEKRTMDNGFPPEVTNHFLFGFPDNWERYATDLFRNDSSIGTELGSDVPENVSAIEPEICSDGLEKSVPSSSKPLKEASGAHGKSHPEVECHDSGTTRGVNAAQGSGSFRRSTRLHNMKVCQQKKPASGVPQKHPEELNSPATPVQLQSLEKENTSSERLVKTSTSRVSKTSFQNKRGRPRKKKDTSEKSEIMCERKTTRSATAVKYPQNRDASPFNIGEKEKTSSVSALSSFKKSRSGRLLLPPLEFWRNQMPIYNADHEVTEIQGGASVVH